MLCFWEMARYRLKYCVKEQPPINLRTKILLFAFHHYDEAGFQQSVRKHFFQGQGKVRKFCNWSVKFENGKIKQKSGSYVITG